MIEDKSKTFDCNGKEIKVGTNLKRVEYVSDFYLELGTDLVKVIAIPSEDTVMVEGCHHWWNSCYFEIVEGKEYRLASFSEDTPIIIACNSREFEVEFEKSAGFTGWVTEWMGW